MSERKALLYELIDPSLILIKSLAQTLSKVGASLTHPTTKQVTTLDNEGEPTHTPETELNSLLQKTNDVSLQWWIAEDHDIYCRIRMLGPLHAVELGMEGCNQRELDAIGKALVDRFTTSKTAIGLVFDPFGTTEDYDWDRFFLHGEQLNWGTIEFAPPQLIGIRSDNLARLVNLPSFIHIDQRGSQILLRLKG